MVQPMNSMYRWSISKTFHPAEQVDEWRLTIVSDGVKNGKRADKHTSLFVEGCRDVFRSDQ